MVGDFVVWHDGIAVAADFDVFAVVLAHGHARINDLRDDEHAFADLFRQLLLAYLQIFQFLRDLRYLRFGLLGKILFAFGHVHADLFADRIALRAQRIAARLGGAELLVHVKDFVYQDEFFVLKFFADVFFDRFRIAAYEFDI